MSSKFPSWRPAPRTAAEWIVRLNRPHVDDRDLADFDAWLAEAPDRRAAFEHALAVWNLAPQMAKKASLSSEWAALSKPRRRQGWRSWPPLLPVAATGAALALLLVLQSDLFAGQRFETAVGGRRIATLEDGSTVWLNTDTRLRVKLEQGRRRVFLDRGEAFFKVARDARRPFTVTANGHSVVVTGTEFDVLRKGRGLEVAVVEGHVRVERADRRFAVDEHRLSAGEQARFVSPSAPPQIERPRAVARKAAWRQGEIYLDNVSLAEAVREVNRYSKVELVIDDPDLAALSLTGVFRTGDIDGFLFAVRQIYRIEGRVEGRRILLDPPQG